MNIVIVTHNRADLLRKALESIVAADKPACYERTIVVENGSQAGAEPIVGEFQKELSAEYHFVEDRRKTVSLNHALEQIDDGLVVFFDDDIRIEPQTLAAYAEAASEGPDRYYGGTVIPDYVVPPPDWLRRYLPASAAGLELSAGESPLLLPRMYLGFNWAVHRETLERFGRFREDLGPGTLSGGGDESFLQIAMNRDGVLGRYVSEARVWHYVPPERCSPDWTIRRAFSGGYNGGRNDQQTSRETGKHHGFARAFYVRLRQRTSRSKLLRAACLRVDGRFWLRHTAHWMTGFVRGWHHGKTVDAPRDAAAIVTDTAPTQTSQIQAQPKPGGC